MRVLVTGMIAGMDDADYLRRVVALGQKNHRDIKVYHAVDDFTKAGKKPLERLLGATDYVFELTREKEYEKIGYEINRHNYQDVIIRAPATLQEADPFLVALKERNHTLYDILSWMNEEVSLSEDWARYMGVPHYVIAVGEPPEALYKLVTHPNPWVVYASYSMSYGTPEKRKEIDKVIHRLRKYAVIVDPQSIEIGTNFEGVPASDRESIYAYTVHRDLHWYVGKVHAVIAIHPYPERPPLSTGMMDELGHARDYMKSRYMIFPRGGFSPFTTDSYIEKGHLFETSDDFFKYLDEVEKRPKFTDELELQGEFFKGQ